MAFEVFTLVGKVSVDVSGLDNSLKSLNSRMKEVGEGFTQMGKQLSMKVTAPIVGLGAAGFKLSGDFDQAFRKVNVMLKASEEEAKAYKEQIMALSNETGKSSVEIADSFYGIVSAGFRGADAIDILTVAMKGATGGAADTTQTVAALTKAMNIFGLEGVDGANKAMDVFFGIVDAGLLSFEEMSQAFPRAATSAAGLGLNIEEVGAALATLTKTSGSTDEAATALNATFTQLISPSESLQALYDEWGVSTGPEAIEKFGGLQGVLLKVQEATDGDVAALSELFPNVRALKSVLPLVTTNADTFAGALDTVSNSTGRTGEAFAEMAQGPGFQMQQGIQSMKNVMITLGDTVASVVGGPLQRMIGVVQKVGDALQRIPGPLAVTIVALAGVAAAAGPVLIIVGQLIKSWALLTGVLTANNLAMVAGKVASIAHAVGLVAYKAASIAATIATTAFGVALHVSTAGLLLAIGAVITAAVLMLTRWKETVNWLKEHWPKLLLLIAPMIAVPALIIQNFDKLKNFFSNLWSNLKAAFLNNILSILNAVDKFAGFLPGVGDAVDKAKAKIESMINADKVKKDAQEVVVAVQTMTKEQAKALEEEIEARKAALEESKASLDTAIEQEVAAVTQEYGTKEELAEDYGKNKAQIIKESYEEDIAAMEEAANKEKEYLTQRIDHYKNKAYEQMAIIDEVMLKEIAAVDPSVAAIIEGYNKEIAGLDAREQAREEAEEQARIDSLKTQLLDDELSQEKRENLERELEAIIDTRDKERILTERNNAIAALGMEEHLTNQTAALENTLAEQMTAREEDYQKQLDLLELERIAAETEAALAAAARIPEEEKAIAALEKQLDDYHGGAEKDSKSVWGKIGKFFTSNWKRRWDEATRAFRTFKDNISKLWDAIYSVASSVLGAIKSVWDTVIGQLQSAWETAWGVISGIVRTQVDIIIGIVRFGWGVLEEIFELISIPFQAAWNLMGLAVETFVSTVQAIIQPLVDWFGDRWEDIGTAFSTVVDGIVSIVEGIWDRISGFVQTCIDGIVGVWETLTEPITTVWDGIVGIVEGIWDRISGPVNTCIDNIKDVWDGITDKTKEIWDGVVDGVKGLWDRVSEPIGTFVGNIKDKFGEIGTKIGSVFSNIPNAFRDAFNRLIDVARNFSWHYSGWSVAGKTIIPKVDFEPFKNIDSLPSFALGGTVPGPIGTPQLVIAHGGEQYLGVGNSIDTSPRGRGITNNFNISQLTVREQADVNRIARELYRIQQTKSRQHGV